jgi:ligand-binding sensor domain-containing protein
VVRPEATLQNALESGLQSKSHSLFSDSDGDLWVYVSTDSTGYFIELRRK